jgi:hypothetical protein
MICSEGIMKPTEPRVQYKGGQLFFFFFVGIVHR